jgi:hypothetical protein
VTALSGRRTLPLAGIVVAALCLAMPAQAAVAAHARLSLSELEVPLGTTLTGQALLLGVNPVQELPGGWEFRAEHVRVAETHQPATGVVGVAVPHDAKPTDSVREFSAAFGFTSSGAANAYMTVTSPQPMAVRAMLPGLTLGAVPSVHFADETVGGLAQLPFTGATAPPVDLPQPAIEAARVPATFPVTVRGDLTVFVYGFNFTVKADDGQQRSFATGFSRHQSTEVQGISVLGETDEGRATLTLTNATFTYRPGGAPYQLDLAAADLGLAGSLRLRYAQGTLEDGGQSTPLQASSLVLDFASATGAVRPAPGGDGRMDAELSGLLTQYAVDGRTVVPQAAASGAPRLGGWGMAAALATVLCVAAAALYLRRRRGDVDKLLQEAEAAFSSGRFRRALSASSRAVRRAPQDMDALVLRCLTRLRLGQAERAAGEINSILAAPDGVGDPGTLHLLHSMCLMESGQEEAAHASLARALGIRPDLGDEVRRSPLFRRALERPELRGLLAQDPGASYT